MSVVSAVEAELGRLGALETVEGQSALVLARNLDTGRNGMSKQGDALRLNQLMVTLRDQSVREADTVDEVRQRRDAKLRAAAAG